MKKSLVVILTFGVLALQANILNECISAFQIRDLKKAQILCEEATKQNSEIFETNFWLSKTYLYSGEFIKAVSYAQKSENFASTIEEYYAIYNVSGVLYGYLGDKKKVLEYNQKSLKIAKEIGDKNIIGADLHNLGEYYRELNNLEEAKKYFFEALEYKTNKASISTTYNALSVLYINQGDNKKAIEYSEKAVTMSKEANDFEKYSMNSVTLASLYIGDSNYTLAESILLEALKIAQDKDLKRQEMYALKWLGVLSFKQGDKKNAKKYYTNALNIAKNIGYSLAIEDINTLINKLD